MQSRMSWEEERRVERWKVEEMVGKEKDEDKKRHRRKGLGTGQSSCKQKER